MSSPPVFRLDHVPPPPASSKSHTPAIAKLQSLLRQYIRVSTTDGRIFIGTFAGTDKLLNIILTNTEEYRLTVLSRHPFNSIIHVFPVRVKGEDSLPDGRYVSLVMVPWAHIACVEAPKRWIEDNLMTG
jgi:small nuclear ribonucleoprotein (snRNP)-like protein